MKVNQKKSCVTDRSNMGTERDLFFLGISEECVKHEV